MRNFFTKFISIFLLISFVLVDNSYSQPWTYDFGTGTGNPSGLFTSTTPSTTYLPTPSSGTARVRVGSGSGSLALVNPGTSLGTASELQINASTGTSTNKFGLYDWNSPSTVGYVKFKLRTTSAGNGNLNFSFGINTLASDNNSYTSQYNNSLISFTIAYTSGSISSVVRRISGSNSTITSSGLAKDTDQDVEVYANNSSSSQTYNRSGTDYSLATRTWDLWVGGTRVVTNAATAGTLAASTNLSGFGFFAESSTSNSAVMYLDDIEYSNSLPTAPVTTYYYKGSGSVLLASNWTDDVTLAAGTSPSAVDATVTNATWTLQNGSAVSLPGSWALGTGSKIVVGGSNAFNLTVPTGASITGGNGVDVSANGTLTLQHTTIPTFGTLSSGSTIVYDAASGTQTLTATNYSNLTLSGGGTRTFPSGTVGISGTFTPGSFTTAGAGTIDFNGTAAQSIPAFTYNNLTISGARTTNNVTLASSGTITVASTPSITATFTVGNGFVVTGSTVAYTLAGTLTIPNLTAVTGGNNYNNLTISGNTTSNKTFAGSSAITIGGTLTTSNTSSGSLILNSTSTARTITINTWNHSSGSVDFGTTDDAGSSGFTSTLNITNTLNKTGGTFTNTATNDYYRINFTGTTASISNTGTLQYPAITINSGTTATLNTALVLTSPPSSALTINGILIAGSNLITATTSGASRVITIGSTGTLRTTNANGLIGSASTTIVNTNTPTLTLNTGSTIEYNGSAQSITARTDYSNVIISGSGINTISGTTTVGGTLTLTSGTLSVGSNTLTLNGPYISGTVNNLTTTSSSNLVLNCTGTGPFTLPNFTAINNLTVNSASQVYNLNSSPTISGALTLTSGKLNIGANTLTLAGTVSGMSASNCLVTNSAATNSNLVVNGNLGGSVFFDQTTDANRGTLLGTNALNNLTIGTSGNVVIGNKVNLFGALDFGSGNGTLSAGDGLLVFRNTSSSTSRLAAVTGTPTITGAVVVENYINNQNRGWRLLTSPLTSAGSGGTVTPSVQSNWQSVMGYGGNYGTNFYSPSGLNGMDGTSNRNSLLRFNGDTLTVGGWTNINSTGVNQFNADAQSGTSSTNPVFFAFIRGDKTVTAVPNAGTPNAFVATTLAAKGRITYGSKTISLLGKTNGYTAIGNPFISPVDLSVAAATGLTGTYYYYNPSNAAWVAVNSSNGWTSGSFTQNMQTGVAVLAQFNGVSSGSIEFTEASKVSTLSTVQTGVGNGLQDNMRINLFDVNSTSGAKTQLDELFVGFKTGYNAGFINTEDGEKMLNAGENLSSRVGNKLVAIDVRPYIQNSDSVFMNFTNTRVANYEFEFDPSNFDATVTSAKLVDKFLNNETPISLSAKTTVPFSVTATAGSNAADRFMVVFNGTGALPNRGFSVTGEKLGTNKVKINWEAVNEFGVKHYELEHSTDGRTFSKINTQVGKNGNVTNSYTYTDNNPANGVNYYRIKTTQNNDIERYSTTITINLSFNTQQSSMVVYPNPVKGNVIGLQLQDLEKGMYSVRLLSIEGKEVYKQQLQVSGNSLSTTISPSTRLAQGTYTLQVVGKNNSYTQKVVVE